jgi:hypothetical protein
MEETDRGFRLFSIFALSMQPVTRARGAAILAFRLQCNLSNVETLFEHRLRCGTHSLGGIHHNMDGK